MRLQNTVVKRSWASEGMIHKGTTNSLKAVTASVASNNRLVEHCWSNPSVQEPIFFLKLQIKLNKITQKQMLSNWKTYCWTMGWIWKGAHWSVWMSWPKWPVSCCIVLWFHEITGRLQYKSQSTVLSISPFTIHASCTMEMIERKQTFPSLSA